MKKYFQHKQIVPALRRMKQDGGRRAKAAEEVRRVLEAIANGDADPFMGIPQTKHGESRIQKCIKYDLTGYCRLVTVLYGNIQILVFVGGHDEEERWLDNNRGLTFLVDGNKAISEITVSGPAPGTKIVAAPDNYEGLLVDRLDDESWDEMYGNLSAKAVAPINRIKAGARPDQIEYALREIDSPQTRDFFFDVLTKLNAGDVEGAKARISLYTGRMKLIDDLSPEEFLSIQDGDGIKQIKIGSTEYESWMRAFLDRSEYHDWFLFMHPEQERFVNTNYDGPAKLSGVSGAGKTCIAIRRAIRLAREMPGEDIAIITLNRSLAGLITNLVAMACPDEEVKSRIKVFSFFHLCQELLREFEPHRARRYSDVTWKLEEHIDEVFREFYRCESNYRAADVLSSTHKSFVSQSIDAENYIREEFDWIRSAVKYGERSHYLDIERKGRGFRLDKSRRSPILDGLKAWEEKMEITGVIDYMGLSTAVTKHHIVTPKFRSIIVDEAQDFGTTELAIIRSLVSPGANDLFLCGDLAQHILPKHQTFSDAGIDIQGRSYTIKRNYRNSREILRAAYGVLYNNLSEQMFEKGDLEILDPQYANRSSAEPILLRAETLVGEIASALELMKQNSAVYREKVVPRDHKGCVVFAGFTHFEVSFYAQSLGYPVLDGTKGLMDGNVFFSDLEQTKGYEFDTVVILNCTEKTLPPAGSPPEDAFRFGAQLYVAMTRAKEQLILSCSSVPSRWLTNPEVGIGVDEWSEFVDISVQGAIPPPWFLPERIDSDSEADELMGFTGREFIYTSFAWGMPADLQSRLEELVAGETRTRAGRRVAWSNVGQLLDDMERGLSRGGVGQVFGPVADQQVRTILANARNGVRPIARRRRGAAPSAELIYVQEKHGTASSTEYKPDPKGLAIGTLDIAPKLHAILHKVGYRTVGQISDLGEDAIARRLNITGTEAATILLAVRRAMLGPNFVLATTHIADLSITRRTRAILREMKIYYVDDVAKMTEKDLLQRPEIGRQEILELKRALNKFGITLRK